MLALVVATRSVTVGILVFASYAVARTLLTVAAGLAAQRIGVTEMVERERELARLARPAVGAISLAAALSAAFMLP